VLPGTTPEMRTPGYWIARMKNPDEIILSQEAIKRMNKEYREKIQSPVPFKDVSKERIPNLDHWWPGYVMAPPDLYRLKRSEVADTVRARIRDETRYLRSREFGNNIAVVYSDREINVFEHEMALDRVSEEFTLRRGIAVRTTQLRNVPSFSPYQIGLWQNGKTRWDMFNVCLLKIAKPVTILHCSRSGEFLFILSDEAYGWVKSEDIALCDKKQAEEFIHPEHFVVCTGDRVMLYSDETCTYVSGWFGMGDRLPLNSTADIRRVRVPARMSDGKLKTATVWLKADADVHRNWLQYTRRNVVITAFKLLDNPYDWTGGWYGRNHETTYRDIFACFGFELPFHGALFTHYGHNEEMALPQIGRKEQYRKILSHEPFITLQSCGGHAQLLLGDDNGEPIVFDQHGYGFTGGDGVEYEVRRCNIGHIRLPSYFLEHPVSFCELK
jgi:hypothetical protein